MIQGSIAFATMNYFSLFSINFTISAEQARTLLRNYANKHAAQGSTHLWEIPLLGVGQRVFTVCVLDGEIPRRRRARDRRLPR